MKTKLVHLLSAMLCAASVALGACAATPAQDQSAASAQDQSAANLATYHALKAAYARHDGAGIASYFTADGTFYSPGSGPKPLTGPAIAGYFQGVFAAFPDFQVNVSEVHATGNEVIDRWVIKGTWTQPFTYGPLAGAKPSGLPFVVPGMSVTTYEGGKISSYTQYWDQLSLLSQIGVIPPPKQRSASME